MAEFFDELVADPFFDSRDAFMRSAQGGPETGFSGEAALPGHSYGVLLAPYTSGSTSLYSAYLDVSAGYAIPAQPGEKFIVTAQVRLSSGSISHYGTLGLRVYGYATPTGGTLSNGSAITLAVNRTNFPTDQWVEVSGIYTVPVTGVAVITPRPTAYLASGATYPPSGSAWWSVGSFSARRADANPKGGVMDIGASTEARLGIVSDVYSRSREKIALELALPDRQLIAGERVELAAAAMTASDVTWYWRQITGPPVTLNKKENTVDFIAPDVTEDTAVRIGLYASSVDGRNRSDWRYFDLTIQPAMMKYRTDDNVGYGPLVTKYVGYDRGPREVWNDVIPPKSFIETPRYDPEIIDLGIAPDDVQFSTDPPPRASRGAVYIDPTTGDVFRNFGEGYNETDDTLAAPRKNAWWVNPATGDILEWIED